MRKKANICKAEFDDYMDQGIDSYIEFVEMCGRGNLHYFSFVNLVCIFVQNPNAELLGSYKYWAQHLNSSVRMRKEGAINVFMTRTLKHNDNVFYDVSDVLGHSERPWVFDKECINYFLQAVGDSEANNISIYEFEKYIKNLTRTDVRVMIKGENSVLDDADLDFLMDLVLNSESYIKNLIVLAGQS